MHWIVFVKGFVVGLLMCAPVGPIGLLCLQRTLTEGRAAGIASVLGAATADGLYCSVAGLGVTIISSFLVRQYAWIQMIGGLVLIALGAKLYFTRPNFAQPRGESRGVLGAYTSAFFLMLANPVPILVFTAAFTALGVHGWEGDYISTTLLVFGVFSGSAIWSPILVTVASLFRRQFSLEQLGLVNRVSGSIMAGFGLSIAVITLLG